MSEYEVRKAKDGKIKIFLKEFNISIAEFYRYASKESEDIKKILIASQQTVEVDAIQRCTCPHEYNWDCNYHIDGECTCNRTD